MSRGGESDELSTSGRFAAAAGASIVSAIVVNPLDVVKTRLQAQAAADSSLRAAQAAHTPRWAMSPALAGCPPDCITTTTYSSHGPSCYRYSSTYDGMQKIVRKEGVRALWRGLDAALLMAVPAVGIYMPLYDMVMARVDTRNPAAPLYAGAIARMSAVLLTSPLELIRTRMQAILHPSSGRAGSKMPSLLNAGSLWSHLALVPGDGALQRVQGMWRGVGATLARDVPFSAVYWGLLEPIRHAMLPADGSIVTPMQTIAANVVAGSLGGASAAVITQPLDVVKTRKQLAAGQPVSTLSTLRTIAREEGMRGLLNGAFPRAMKAAPACAIVLASYECMKLAFKASRREEMQLAG